MALEDEALVAYFVVVEVGRIADIDELEKVVVGVDNWEEVEEEVEEDGDEEELMQMMTGGCQY